MADSYESAAIRAAKCHYYDREEDPIAPGQIFEVRGDGDSGGETTYFLADNIMSKAGFELTKGEA